MSTEEAVTDALQVPVDSNAQAAEDAKKLLAELQDDASASNGIKQDDGEQPKEVDPTDTKAEAPRSDEHEEKEPRDKGRDSDRRRDGYQSRSERGGRGRGRGRGRDDRNGHSHRSYRDNIKSVLTSEEISSDPVAIRKQVEFYFSDSNLPKDDFLFQKTGGTENKPVPLEAIHSFKRMRHFQPFSAIVDALRESTVVELADDDTAVRRRKPWEPTYDNNAAMRRSIYAKGFGEEVPSTQFDIEAFFAEFGATNEVRLRRSNDKIFKGSVFVEFESEALATSFLEQETKPKFKGNELQIMSKKEYCDKKNEDIKSGKIKPNTTHSNGKPYDRDRRGDSKRKRDNEDDRDWRTRRDEDRKRGFRDDKRHGGGDRRRGSGYGGGRSGGPNTQDTGVPAVRSSASKHDSGRDEALAKARAAVEAENKKDSTGNIEAAAESTDSKNRAREDDVDAGDEREPKKVDTKVESTNAS